MQTYLLIDDDSEEQELFSIALSQIDPQLQCQVLDSGLSIADKLSDRADRVPDLIFLDLNIPRKNGLEILKELKAHEHLQQVPVFIYSSSLYPDDIQGSKALGAKGYIVKPSSFPKLVEILCRVREIPSDGLSYFYHDGETEQVAVPTSEPNQ